MSFPNNLDTFVVAQDITQADISNLNAYQSAMAQGNIALANQHLAQMQNGIAQQLNASRFNSLIDAIANLEGFYYQLDGVKIYITNQISKYTYIGEWNSGATYAINQIVIAGTDWYVCTQANIGQNPQTTTGYWQVLISQRNAKQYYVGNNPQISGVAGTIVFNTNV